MENVWIWEVLTAATWQLQSTTVDYGRLQSTAADAQGSISPFRKILYLSQRLFRQALRCYGSPKSKCIAFSIPKRKLYVGAIIIQISLDELSTVLLTIWIFEIFNVKNRFFHFNFNFISTNECRYSHSFVYLHDNASKSDGNTTRSVVKAPRTSSAFDTSSSFSYRKESSRTNPARQVTWCEWLLINAFVTLHHHKIKCSNWERATNVRFACIC